MKYFSHGPVLINVDDVRLVQLIPSPPQGGKPFHPKGVVVWSDGSQQTVSFEFASALKEALKQDTVTIEESAGG